MRSAVFQCQQNVHLYCFGYHVGLVFPTFWSWQLMLIDTTANLSVGTSWRWGSSKMLIRLSVSITLVIIISLKVQVKVIMHKNVCPFSVLRRSALAFFWTKLVYFKFRVGISNFDRWMYFVIIVIYMLWTLTFLFWKNKNEQMVR